MEIPYVYTVVNYLRLISRKYFLCLVGFEKSPAKYAASGDLSLILAPSVLE